jgi:hypothetical protein
MKKSNSTDRRRKHRRIEKQFHARRLTLREIERADSVPLEAYQVLQELVVGLRRKRKEGGLSLDAIAAASGLDKGYISRLENGKVLNPTFETLYRYARAIQPIRSMRDLVLAGVND